MATYELDDDAVRAYLADDAPVRSGAEAAIVRALSEQLPIPVPTKIGAIVRTDHPNPDNPVFIRWAFDTRTHSPWILAGDHETPWRTDEIGRITEVLFEGVDL